MGRQSKKSRIYWRERGGTSRAYADLRDYADVGGGREALVAEDEKLATADETTAQVLLARRLEQLDAARRGRALHGETRQVTLADFAASHLVAKAESQKFTEHWLEVTEKCLDRAIDFFGGARLARRQRVIAELRDGHLGAVVEAEHTARAVLDGDVGAGDGEAMPRLRRRGEDGLGDGGGNESKIRFAAHCKIPAKR